MHNLLYLLEHVQEFGPTGKEGKLMLPHPDTNPDGFNILHVSLPDLVLLL